MSDCREVFTASELSKELNLTTAYINRVAHSLKLTEKDVRKAGLVYLYSTHAVQQIKKKLNR